MNLQRLVLSHSHISETVTQQEHLSLYTDETSKFGNKVCGYHVRDEEGNFFTLGLRDLVTKSAKDTLETFTEILQDIDHAAENGPSASRQILTNITSTMSDSASTEIKFSSLLEEYRAAVLPYTIENYHELDEEGKKSVSKLNNFFCGLHSLVHMADTCAKCVNEVEKTLFVEKTPINDPSFRKEGDSGTVRLIRTSSKAFARGADEKSGCHLQFITYISEFLKENKMRSLKLVPLRGQRFNILFHNASQVYFLHKKMKDFLNGFQLNRLTKSVAFDLAIPAFISGCKALGLINKLVTTPLWALLENKEIQILEMDKYYLMLKNGLEDASKNVPAFMAGNIRPFQEEVPVKEDSVFQCVIQQSEYDNDCELFLSVILVALAKYVSMKFKDFLPGGVYCNPSEEMKAKTKSVEKHNKFTERVFAYYDNLLRYKPHIKTLASEAYVAFAVNKTGEWLKQKPDSLIESSRQQVTVIRQKFKYRQNIIREKRRQKIEEQRQARADAEARKTGKLQDITNEVLYYGLWQSPEQVDNLLQDIPSKTEKVKALKTQLRFRKEVFKQNLDNQNVYHFSKSENGKSVPLKIEELTVNVKALIQHSLSLPREEDHLDDRVVLVGQKIRHKFENDGTETWSTGKVISQVPGYPEWFNVVYEADPAVYSYQLMVDYRKGDLEICL